MVFYVINANRINIALVCLIVICVLSCGNKAESRSENTDAPIRLKQITSWEINAPEIIPHPYQAGVLDDGSLILIDWSLNTINHFDQNGRLIRILGGAGHGPGEYGRMTHVAVHPDGRVAVADLKNVQITIQNVYDTGLAFVRLDAGWHTRLSWVSSGLIITNSPFRIGGTSPGDILMRIYNPDTEIKKQFMHLQLALEDPPPDQISCTFCDFRFQDDLSFFTSPQDTSYRIYKVDPTIGDTILFSRSGVPAIALTEAEREEWQNQKRQMMPFPELSMEGELKPPEYKERFRFYFPDHKGRLWALMNVPEGRPLHFDVFSGDGVYLGSVNVPEEVKSVPFVSGDQILFRHHSDDPDLWKGGLYRIIDE